MTLWERYVDNLRWELRWLYQHVWIWRQFADLYRLTLELRAEAREEHA